jgi:hypothetical protein
MTTVRLRAAQFAFALLAVAVSSAMLQGQATKVSGDNQSGATTRTLPRAFVVHAIDPNLPVVFAVIPGGGGAGGSFGGQTSVIVNTDTNANAVSPLLTANAVAGTFTVEASEEGGLEDFS